MMGRRNRGFTLVELLVVVAIIGMLVAIIVPAVNRARATARRTQCMNNMRQVGQAMIMYATTKEYFPGRVSEMVINNRARGEGGRIAATWVMRILPDLGRNDLHDELMAGTDYYATYEGILVCPSDQPASRIMPELSYVVNSGIPDFSDKRAREYIPDSAANGVCHNLILSPSSGPASLRVTTDSLSRRDGPAMTILLSENVDAGRWAVQLAPNDPTPALTAPFSIPLEMHKQMEIDLGIVWNVGQPTPLRINQQTGDRGRLPNIDDYTFARPSSNHSGGVNVVFCGGHAMFLREDIELRVYQQLMAPSDREAGLRDLGYTPLSEADFN